jgi:2-oxoglutarate dehydrogenase E2 component (dihydrolipoamide succinyltransferase)
VTAVFEPDLSAVIAHRLAHKPAYAAEGVNLTLTAYCVRASVAALQAVPEVNSRWHEDALELLDDCNIGIATALTGGGLIVPVIHRAQDLDLLETARRLQDLTTRAREGKLQPKDVQGGTFTISNHGVSGSLLAAPIIINQPQSAILGVGKIERRVKVTEGGAMEPRPMAYVTLTIDHRVLDGFQANAFLTKWVETVERWS